MRKFLSSISTPLLIIIVILIISILIITYLRVIHAPAKEEDLENLHRATNYIIDTINKVAGRNRTIEIISPSLIEIYNPFKDKSVLKCRITLNDLNFHKEFTYMIEEGFNKIHLPITPIGKHIYPLS